MGVNLTQKPTWTPILKKKMMPSTWTGLGLGTEKDVNFSSYVSVDSELVSCGVSSIEELFDDREGGGSGEEDEEGDEREPEPVPSFTEAHAAFETVKSFFYVHSIGEHDEQVILNLELVLFI
jgi:hypothetical protein